MEEAKKAFSKSLYAHVISCIDLLQTTQVKWSDTEKDYGTTIITHYEHHRGTGKIEVVLYKELVKKVVEVSQNEHFSFLKKHLYRLQNAQAIKLFPYFVSWRNRGVVEISLDIFKKKFGFDTEGYSRFSNLQKYVLDPAISEINEKTELTVSYKLQGDNLQGLRPRVTGLQFFIKENKVKELGSERKKNNSKTDNSNDAITAQNQIDDTILMQYYEQVADFWGVDLTVFKKTASTKTEQDIKKAIDYTKEQVRAGKADRPAAVFIDALKNGYETINAVKQKKAELAEQQKREKIEQQTKVEKSVAQQKKQELQLQFEKNKARLLEVLDDDTNFYNELLDTLRANHFINQYFDADKTISENMENPMLAGSIMNIVVKMKSEIFADV